MIIVLPSSRRSAHPLASGLRIAFPPVFDRLDPFERVLARLERKMKRRREAEVGAACGLRRSVIVKVDPTGALSPIVDSPTP